MTDEKIKSRRGFGGMSKEKVTAIAKKGGASIPSEKRAFSVNRTLAQEAGRKGGLAGRKPKDT